MTERLSIVKNFWIWLLVSIVVIFVGMYSFFLNFRKSIEFTGWIKVVIEWNQNIDKVKVKNLLKEFEADIEILSENNNTELLIVPTKLNNKKPSDVWDKLHNWLKDKWYIKSDKNIISTSFIGPTIWEYMTKAAKWWIIWWLIIMAVYILIAFVWVREYFSPWIFSLVTVLTLAHDVIAAAGWYGVLMHFDKLVMVDSVFVMAILTILWYSINDTIVIFDRIRENLIIYNDRIQKGTIKIYEVFDKSLYQTMRRSLGTSISTFLVVFAMWYFGSEVLKDFSFTIMVWIVAWTYSSIFIAAPGAYRINRIINKKQ